jgi:hypothetical protein
VVPTPGQSWLYLLVEALSRPVVKVVFWRTGEAVTALETRVA